MCIHARLLCFKNPLSWKDVRKSKSSVFLWLPSLICLLALSLNGGLARLSSIASLESDSACFAYRWQVKINLYQCCSQFFISGNFYVSFVSTSSLASLAYPKTKEKQKLPTTYMLNKQIRKSRKGCYTDTRTCFSRNTMKCCCRRIMLFSRYTSSLIFFEVIGW